MKNTAYVLTFAVLLVAGWHVAVLAGPSDIAGTDNPLEFTRAPLPSAGDSSSGEDFELSISGTSAAIGSAMNKREVYRIGCTVDTLCEFGASAPTADTNSAYYVPAGGFDYFLVKSPAGTDNDWIACIAEDGSSSGTCYIKNMK